jgi:ferredoxin
METDGTGTLKPKLHAVPNIDAARCTGCGRCVAACPEKIITLEVSCYRKHAVIQDTGKCTLCGQCKLSCLVDAVAAS